jgi:hypothetical protein
VIRLFEYDHYRQINAQQQPLSETPASTDPGVLQAAEDPQARDVPITGPVR